MLFNLICAVPYGTLPTVMWIETSDCMPWSPWAYTGLDIDIDMASKVAPVAAPKAKATAAACGVGLPASEVQMPALPSSHAILSDAERLAQYLLVDRQGWDRLENFKVARMVKHKYGAEVVREAFELLAENGIVEVEAWQRQRRGPARMVIKKRSWMELTSDANNRSTIFLEKLRVNREAFSLRTMAAAFKVFVRKVGEEGQEVEVTPDTTVRKIKAQHGLKRYFFRFNGLWHNNAKKMTDLGVEAGETIDA